MYRNIALSIGLLVLLAGCGLRSPGQDPTQVPSSTQPAASTSTEAVETAVSPVSATEEIFSTPTMETHAHPADPASQAIESMAHEHLQAGPHIQLTETRPPTQEDAKRAEEVVRAARQALGKYRDYRRALEDGYVIFGEEVPQDMYHFINYRETLANLNSFDPARPTALLYKKVGDGWQFTGAMYSAPWESTEEELDDRFPLSMAQWHAHVNICVPRDLSDLESHADDPKFGFEGSIDTREACSAAGGRFFPEVLGWMVHVDLFESE